MRTKSLGASMIGAIALAFALASFSLPTLSHAATLAGQACPALSRALGKGSRGADVQSLQQYLVSQGLLTSDSATGYFGNLTQQALQKWQASHGIASSGTPSTTGYGSAGPKTRKALGACASGGVKSSLPPSVPLSRITAPIKSTAPAPFGSASVQQTSGPAMTTTSASDPSLDQDLNSINTQSSAASDAASSALNFSDTPIPQSY